MFSVRVSFLTIAVSAATGASATESVQQLNMGEP